MKLHITYQFEPALEIQVRVRPARRLPAIRRLLARLARSETPLRQSLKRASLTRLVPNLEIT